MLALTKQGLGLLGIAIVAASLAGCASSGSGRVPVGFTSGGDCQSVRAELRKLDAVGTPGQIQAKQAGARVSPEAMSRISRYNALLEEYLGNDCQLPPGGAH